MVDTTTRYVVQKIPIFMILLYRRLLWRTGDNAKKIATTLYHPLIPGEHEMTFSRRSLPGIFHHFVIN